MACGGLAKEIGTGPIGLGGFRKREPVQRDEKDWKIGKENLICEVTWTAHGRPLEAMSNRQVSTQQISAPLYGEN